MSKVIAIQKEALILANLMNKNFIISILLLSLMLMISLFFYEYDSYKKEMFALKIKVNLLSDNKRKSVSWKTFKDLVLKKQFEAAPSNVKKEGRVLAPFFSKDRQEPIEDIETELLILKVESTLSNLKELSQAELDRGIQLSNELILRNPNVYLSYKAKLILLLTKEMAYNSKIEEEEVNNLLETMSQFDVLSDVTIKKEAFLIAKTNAEIDKLFDDIENLETDLMETDKQDEIQYIESNLMLKIGALESMEARLEEGLLNEEDFLNEDLVEIPFLRALAKEDYDHVIQASSNLLVEFPNSIIGYLFFIRANELVGRREVVLDIIKDSNLSPDALKKLELRLSKLKKMDVKEYWKRLRI